MPVYAAGAKDEVQTSRQKTGAFIGERLEGANTRPKASQAVLDLTFSHVHVLVPRHKAPSDTMPNPSAFREKKRRILEDLAAPTEEYTDLSPKGSVDEGVRELCDEINRLDGYVTTSSCAGRIAVYRDGPGKDRVEHEVTASTAREAGKGGKGGGQWLFVSHDPINANELQGEGEVFKLFGMQDAAPSVPAPAAHSRLVYLKFEPMVSAMVHHSPSLLFPHLLVFRYYTFSHLQFQMHKVYMSLPTALAFAKAVSGASLVESLHHMSRFGHKACRSRA